MMLSTTRIIAIDDEREHLSSLMEGLAQYGAACLPIYFNGNVMDIPPCPHARIIFADLHLIGGAQSHDHKKDFGAIGGLIEDTIKPSGPYFIILWTRYADKANLLHDFLKERLGDMPKPLIVCALDKNEHLDLEEGNIKNPLLLVESIKDAVSKQPQVAALLNWEERISDAASNTVSSILKLGSVADAENEELDKLLGNLASAAVGENRVTDDHFRSVNNALLPILADRIASIKSQDDNTNSELWQAAFAKSATKEKLTPGKIAKLNHWLHIDDSEDKGMSTERGAVISLLKMCREDKFKEIFGLAQDEAAKQEFGCKEFQKICDKTHWVLVQSQAACDYAQKRPGPLPFHLGLMLPESKAAKGKLRAAVWTSPLFEFNDEICLLNVNARFEISLTGAKIADSQPLFRLREQLLNDLIFKLHSYGARPGVISFR